METHTWEVLGLLTSPRENHRQRPEIQVQVLGLAAIWKESTREGANRSVRCVTIEEKPPRK